MRHLSVLAAAVAVGTSLSTAFGNGAPPCGERCSKALSYLAGSCRAPFPPSCINDIHSQAVEFCSSYLSLTATSLATTTGLTTITVTESDTVESTVVETSTTTTATTTTEISTSTDIALSTVISTSYIPPPVVTVTVKRRGPATSCPDLATRTSWLAQRPASKLSSICSRLGVTATTISSTATVSSTATSSETTTTTDITTSTALEVSTSITTFTSTTVTTSSAVVTSTVVVDYCDPSVAVGLQDDNTGAGNGVLTPGGIQNANECCRLCWSTLDCVASSFPNDQCQLLVKSNPASGGATSPQCPLGVDEVIVYDDLEPRNVFRGPCGPLL